MVKKTLALLLVSGLFAVSAAAHSVAAPKKKGKADAASLPSSLASGEYSAHVAMLACEACGPEIEKILNATKGVENAKVDSNKATVTFKVKPGSAVEVAALQKKLKAKADEMGMGADYRLSKITALAPAKPAQKS